MLHNYRKVLLGLHRLHIDAALSACAVSVLCLKVFEAEISLGWVALLGLVTWVIYSSDRMLDAAKANPTAPLAARHATLLWPHFWPKLLTGGTAFVALIVGFMLLPFFKFLIGLILAFSVGIYLWIVHVYKKMPLPKEVIISLLYTLGCFMPVYFSNSQPLNHLPVLLWFVALTVTVFLNLLLNSYADYEYDIQHAFTSIATAYGLKWINKLFIWFFTANFALIIFLLTQKIIPAAILALMCALTGVIFYRLRNTNPSQKKLMLKIASDWVFHLPWLVLLFP